MRTYTPNRKITSVRILEVLRDAFQRDSKLTVNGIVKKLTGREFPERRHFQRTWALLGSLHRKGAVTLEGSVAGLAPAA